ncbi:MAG: hypothetical protein QM767_15125 [Anaeromyxobacter sp.]
MSALLALTLAAAAPGLAPADGPDAALAGQAVAAALAVDGRAELLGVRRTSGGRCEARRAEALRPVAASGEITLRLSGADAAGQPCEAFAWARVRVLAPALVLSRDLPAGEPLDGAVAPGEAEVLPARAPLATLQDGARASHALAAGAVLRAGDVRLGPAPGEPIAVRVVSGEIQLTTTGRAVACPRGRACALLPSGRRVEGRLAGDTLIVEAP